MKLLLALMMLAAVVPFVPSAAADTGCSTNVDQDPLGEWYAQCTVDNSLLYLRCGISVPIFCPCFPPCTTVP